jgi:hypothetical protein
MAKPAQTAVPAVIEAPSPTELEVMSYQDLMALMDSGNAVHIQELEDRVMMDQATLVNMPLVITGWKFSNGSFGEFAIVQGITHLGTKFIFTDGGTGITEQLHMYQAKLDGIRPIAVPKGLRRSDYLYHDAAEDKDIPATTFYISNEA